MDTSTRIPPPLPPDPVTQQDLGHLQLLSVFHYVVGAIGFLCACLPLIHVGLGVMMIVAPGTFSDGGQHAPPPAFLGYFFAGMGALFMLAGWAVAICTIISGWLISRRKKRLFSFVLACVLCLFTPLGTVLGIFTIIVLNRPSVQRLYERS